MLVFLAYPVEFLAEDPFGDSTGACIPFTMSKCFYQLIVLCKPSIGAQVFEVGIDGTPSYGLILTYHLISRIRSNLKLRLSCLR